MPDTVVTECPGFISIAETDVGRIYEKDQPLFWPPRPRP
jgi:hypothetical protein